MSIQIVKNIVRVTSPGTDPKDDPIIGDTLGIQLASQELLLTAEGRNRYLAIKKYKAASWIGFYPCDMSYEIPKGSATRDYTITDRTVSVLTAAGKDTVRRFLQSIDPKNILT